VSKERHKVRRQTLERVRTVRRALDAEVFRLADERPPRSIDGNIVDALLRARTELERVELQLEAELREGKHDLTCVECGSTSADDTTHWKAYLSVDNELAIFCPVCATPFELGLADPPGASP
jgi:uncharacterized Zn-finger protein